MTVFVGCISCGAHAEPCAEPQNLKHKISTQNVGLLILPLRVHVQNDVITPRGSRLCCKSASKLCFVGTPHLVKPPSNLASHIILRKN
jgi:hypothetical protein